MTRPVNKTKEATHDAKLVQMVGLLKIIEYITCLHRLLYFYIIIIFSIPFNSAFYQLLFYINKFPKDSIQFIIKSHTSACYKIYNIRCYILSNLCIQLPIAFVSNYSVTILSMCCLACVF